MLPYEGPPCRKAARRDLVAVDKMPLAHPIDDQIRTFASLAMSPMAGSLAAK
jgi:hypothetical protein